MHSSFVVYLHVIVEVRGLKESSMSYIVITIKPCMTPCFGQEPSTITLMSFVRVADANLEDSGDYVVHFTQEITEFSQEYHVTVGELLHASLVSTLVTHHKYCSVGIM